MMMGEFGRSPVINRDAGRDHWTNVMSLVLAGGGLRHGQVIGATDRKGHSILDRRSHPARPRRHRLHPPGNRRSIPNGSAPQGRPTPIVAAGGRPIAELF